MNSPRTDQSGMTLVELLVVAVLLAVMSGLLYGTLGGIIRAREALLVKRQAYRSAATFFSRIRGEFAGAQSEPLYAGGNGLQDSGSANSTAAAGAPVRYVVGTNVRTGSADADTIRFSTASGAQELYDAESNRGLIEVAYRLEASEQPGADSRFGVLVREEMPAGIRNEAILKRRRRTFPVCDRVISFNIRYYRDSKWQNEWKEATSRLPKALDIELVIADDHGDPVVARTALPFGPPKLESSPSSIQIAGGEGGFSPSPTPTPGR